MTDISINLSEELIRTGIETAMKEALKSSYSNPVSKIVDKALNDQAGEIKKIVDQIIVDAISNPEFKSKMSDMVIQRLVEMALKK